MEISNDKVAELVDQTLVSSLKTELSSNPLTVPSAYFNLQLQYASSITNVKNIYPAGSQPDNLQDSIPQQRPREESYNPLKTWLPMKNPAQPAAPSPPSSPKTTNTK